MALTMETGVALRSRKQHFPPDKHQCHSTATPAIAPGAEQVQRVELLAIGGTTYKYEMPKEPGSNQNPTNTGKGPSETEFINLSQ